MDSCCPVEIKPGDGVVMLSVHDLLVPLGQDDALLFLDWLEQSLGCSVLFLFKLECPNFEIEGRNYDRHLDFLVFQENVDGMRALSFTMQKKHAAKIIDKLRCAVEASFGKPQIND